jgi:hypothetical protein
VHQQHVLTPVKQHYLHTECRGMPQVHQQHVLHLSNSITYSLRAEECHKSISNMSCACQTASLTSWGQRNATSLSATCPAHAKQHHLQTECRGMPQVHQHHLQSESRGMPQLHQQHVLHLSNGITYRLSAEECHKSISNMSCACQTASLTY